MYYKIITQLTGKYDVSFTLKGAADIDLVMFPIEDIESLKDVSSSFLELTSQRSRAYDIDWKITIQVTKFIYIQSQNIQEGTI